MLTPQNGQTQLNNSLATADKLFERVWPVCGVGAWRLKGGMNNLPLADQEKSEENYIRRISWSLLKETWYEKDLPLLQLPCMNKSEAYSEPSETFKIERFAKIILGYIESVDIVKPEIFNPF